MNTLEKIINLINQEKLGYYQFENIIGLARGSIANWRAEKSKPSTEALHKIADYFNVSIDYLVGRKTQPNFEPEEIVKFPVLAGIAAGFNHGIKEYDFETGEFQEVPRSIMRGHSKDDLLVFRVEGDSMSPEFRDGDRVLVKKQSSVDSGNIAVVCYEDYENGTIKKIHYQPNCNYVDLIPLNPKFNPVRIQGHALEGMQIVGKVIYLFREVNY